MAPSREQRAKEALNKIRELERVSRTATSRRAKVEAAIKKIQLFHDLGRNLPPRQRHKDAYGRGIIKDEADRLHINEDTVRKARAFAEGYTKEELRELCRRIREVQTDQEEGLAVFEKTHVIRLLSIPEGEEREVLQEQAIQSAWSCAELEAEIAKKYGPRRQGGRRRRVPADPGGLLTQLVRLCESWRRWHAALGSEDGDQSRMKNLPSGIRRQVETTTQAVAALQEAVEKRLRKERE